VEKHLLALCTRRGWTLHSHRWIEGPEGFLQPDFFIVQSQPESPQEQSTESQSTQAPNSILLECKLTWTDTSLQLSKYLRALQFMGYEPVPVTVCRNLNPIAPAPILSLDEIYPWATWHLWI
jgi:hypothetical protein